MLLRPEALSLEQKAVLEQILGRQIGDAESISVRAFDSEAVPRNRQRGLEGIKRLLGSVNDGSRDWSDPALNLSSDPASEQIIVEAIRSVRPGYTPVP